MTNSADIASTARVQNQNDRVIAACERELRRNIRIGCIAVSP